MSERKRGTSPSQESGSSQALEVESNNLGPIDINKTPNTPSQYGHDISNIIRSRARVSQIARRPLPILTAIAAVVMTIAGQIVFNLVLNIS